MIDITHAFETVFSRNIIAVSFGDDISDLVLDQYVETSKGSGKYELKKLTYT